MASFFRCNRPPPPWSSLLVDFIVGLPDCKGLDSVMVVVDRYTKMAKFFPCSSTITAKGMADIFVQEIFARHGVPSKIISDRGPQFISQFWTQFLKGLEIKPCRSSGYHPQSNGQTERTNQILEQYLRCYVPARQDTWPSHICMAQFAYNNALQVSIGMSPFMANHGYHPLSPVGTPSKLVPAAENLVKMINNSHATLARNLQKAISAYKNLADKNRMPAPLWIPMT